MLIFVRSIEICVFNTLDLDMRRPGAQFNTKSSHHRNEETKTLYDDQQKVICLLNRNELDSFS